MKRLLLLVGTAVALSSVSPAATTAATAGIAFDSVQRFDTGGGAYQPGTFATDFARASAPNAASPKRGLFNIGAIVAAASGAVAMFKDGTAERHYSAGMKSRVDTVATGEARITDCRARTLTTLDLKAKTYTVTSLDAVETPEPRRRERSTPGPLESDDGSKIAMSMTTKTLGALPIDGIATTGYDARMKTVVTRPGSDAQSFETTLVSYFSGYAEPRESCPEASRVHARADARDEAAMSQLALALKAMKTPSGDPRFTVSSTGPAMPVGKLALWQHMTLASGGMGTLVERGNVRAVTEADPIFSVPPDFTKRP
ncbi:MAG: hypothetical protein NVS2B3_03250 [Vulcanimicrobiaceae bacterium]